MDRGEGAALQYLPEKLKTEVALYANVATLQKAWFLFSNELFSVNTTAY